MGGQWPPKWLVLVVLWLVWVRFWPFPDVCQVRFHRPAKPGVPSIDQVKAESKRVRRADAYMGPGLYSKKTRKVVKTWFSEPQESMVKK